MKILKNLGVIKSINGVRRTHVIAECFCGKEFKATLTKIKTNKIKSCGCLQRYVSKQKEYMMLQNMKARCYNVNFKQYHHYGGRGIDICQEWRENSQSFVDWCRANGYKKGLVIDRIDNDKGYSPSNCRFVTHSVNSQNTRLLRSDNTSGFRGVCKDKCKTGPKWVSRIHVGGNQICLGRFHTKEGAAIAYNNYVIENKTEHPLNKI